MNDRKIIQISMGSIGNSSDLRLVALCDDGSLWVTLLNVYSHSGRQEWVSLTPPPKS